MNLIIKLILLAGHFFFLTLQLQAQELLIPYAQNEKWGFADAQKNIIISPQYDEVRPFLQDTSKTSGKSKAFANVKYNGKWGVITPQNKFIVHPKYSQELEWDATQDLFYASIFGEESEETYFFILNDKGEEIFKCEGYINWRGFDQEGIAYLEVEGKVGFINREGKVLIPFEYEPWSPVTEYCHGEGLFGVIKDGMFGFVNAQNEVLIPFRFDHVPEFMGCFQGGKAMVSLNGQAVVIDKKGRVIETPTYKSTFVLDSLGYTIAEVNETTLYTKYVLLDTQTGKQVMDETFDYLTYEGGLFVANKAYKYGLISPTSLEYVQEMTMDEFPKLYKKEGKFYWKLSENGLKGIINQEGKRLLPNQYSKIYGLLSEKSPVIVSTGGSYRVVDAQNNVLKRLYYQGIFSSFMKEAYFITIGEGDLQGIVRYDGKEVIPPSYQRVSQFGEVFLALQADDTQIILNRNGKRIGKDILDNHKYVGFAPIGEEYGEVAQHGKLGVLGPKGQWIVPCRYEKIMTVANSDKLFWVQENGLYGIRDTEKVLISPRYTEITNSFLEIDNQLYLLINHKGKRGYIDLKGTEFFD